MILERLKEVFPGEVLSTHQEKGDLTAIVRKDRVHEVLKFLKDDPSISFDLLADLAGVDYLSWNGGERPRFEVVYHFYSLTHNHRLRLRVRIPEEDMRLPTATDLWKSADWFEREAAEMFGFVFEGHPNPRPLLLFEGFVGHPLRKDYKIDKRQKIPTPEEKPT